MVTDGLRVAAVDVDGKGLLWSQPVSSSWPVHGFGSRLILGSAKVDPRTGTPAAEPLPCDYAWAWSADERVACRTTGSEWAMTGIALEGAGVRHYREWDPEFLAVPVEPDIVFGSGGGRLRKMRL